MIRVRSGAAVVGAAARRCENEPRADWREDAKCYEDQVDPELFFPLGYKKGPDQVQIRAAKMVCRQCPVQGQCLEWAVESHVTDGVFGGMTPDERRIFRTKGTNQ